MYPRRWENGQFLNMWCKNILKAHFLNKHIFFLITHLWGWFLSNWSQYDNSSSYGVPITFIFFSNCFLCIPDSAWKKNEAAAISNKIKWNIHLYITCKIVIIITLEWYPARCENGSIFNMCCKNKLKTHLCNKNIVFFLKCTF